MNQLNHLLMPILQSDNGVLFGAGVHPLLWLDLSHGDKTIPPCPALCPTLCGVYSRDYMPVGTLVWYIKENCCVKYSMSVYGTEAGLQKVGTACTGGTRQITFGKTKLY